MAKFRIDIDNKRISRKINRKIEDGIEDAADEINDKMRQAAKGKIRDEKAVWRKELLHGFTDSKIEISGRTIASLRNLSEHAPYQEMGVNGTQNARFNTPFQYKDKKPPLDSLIPWVRDNLAGTFWPGDLGEPPDGYLDSGSTSSTSNSGSSGSGSSGGSNVTFTQTGVPLDDNSLYAGEPGYIIQDMNVSYQTSNLFPKAKIVVYNTKKKQYDRAEIIDFPGQKDTKIRFVLDRTAGVYTIENSNADDFRLVGYEDFDALPESDIKQRLRDYFDDAIRGAEDKEVLNKTFAKKKGLVKPDSNRMDWIRDKWTSDIWDLYDDKWLVKEQIRNLTAVVDYDSSKLTKGGPNPVGGIGPYNDSPRFMAIFLDKQKLNTYTSLSEDEYLDTLKHESEHALSATQFFGHVGVKSYGSNIKDYAEFDRNGNELTGKTTDSSGNSITLPKDAKLQMVHDNASSTGGVVGGTNWIGNAYDAAKKGVSGIESYTPTFKNTTKNPLARLHEAVNKAYWLQVVEVTERRKRGEIISKKDNVFVERAYSITNAEETLATFHAVMSSVEEKYEERIRYIHELYPWLIEAWIEIHNPPENVAEILRELGYNV